MKAQGNTRYKKVLKRFVGLISLLLSIPILAENSVGYVYVKTFDTAFSASFSDDQQHQFAATDHKAQFIENANKIKPGVIFDRSIYWG